MIRLFCGLTLALLLAGCGGGTATQAPPPPEPIDPALYLTLETGTLPIIISAPHGGTTDLPGVPVRTSGTTVLDTNTYELALAIQQHLVALTGHRAHLIAARASRKYVDFNRSASEAYQSANVAPLYQAYQNALVSAVALARTSERALLVDVHGQSFDVHVVFRGTRDGQTADLPMLYTSGRFLERLVTSGMALNPTTAGGTESPDFNGGYIVATYGKLSASGINSVQLEFGYDFRATSADLEATATAVATALVAHLQGL
ncbi:MAG: N-formylglutamate amidohydrolase [Holophaga sp.]|nr:N-formylglutamate amidohydrolase [Holophaga sp.]